MFFSHGNLSAVISLYSVHMLFCLKCYYVHMHPMNTTSMVQLVCIQGAFIFLYTAQWHMYAATAKMLHMPQLLHNLCQFADKMVMVTCMVGWWDCYMWIPQHPYSFVMLSCHCTLCAPFRVQSCLLCGLVNLKPMSVTCLTRPEQPLPVSSSSMSWTPLPRPGVGV